MALQIAPIIAAGVGIYLGIKLVHRVVIEGSKVKASQRGQDGNLHKANTPKDLGVLEYDEATDAYRPKT